MDSQLLPRRVEAYRYPRGARARRRLGLGVSCRVSNVAWLQRVANRSHCHGNAARLGDTDVAHRHLRPPVRAPHNPVHRLCADDRDRHHLCLDTSFIVLFVIGVVGTMNPSSGDVSVFLPIEQSLLPATVADSGRTAMFARYAFIGSLCGAIGSLAAGIPERIARRLDWQLAATLRWVFIVYSVGAVVMLVVYRQLSSAIEPPPHQTPQPLGASRAIVYRLAAVFSLDAFGGGFVVQSLLALWLFRRFDLSVGAAGTLLFWTGVCSAFSAFVSSRIAKRIGLIRTMVFTHLPAQMLLIATAFMPNLGLAVACLIARSLLSAMDVPARNSYVMAVVSPPERAAAASVTNVPRSLASALPPIAAGWMLDHSTFGWPLILAGSSKATYDLLLLMMFRNLRHLKSCPMNAADVWDSLSGPWRLAFEEAWASFRSGNFGIGAAVVDPETLDVVALGRNRVAERQALPRTLTGNMTAHAEMNAFAKIDRFNAEGLHLYTTLEPCLMCIAAAMQLKIAHVHFGARDEFYEGMHELWIAASGDRGSTAAHDGALPRRACQAGPVRTPPADDLHSGELRGSWRGAPRPQPASSVGGDH